MDIDEKQLRELLLWLLDLIYTARTELIAYKVAHTFLSAAGASQELDQFLEQTRKHPSPALLADHQAAKDKVEELLNEGKVDAALEFLRNWQPKGPIQ